MSKEINELLLDTARLAAGLKSSLLYRNYLQYKEELEKDAALLSQVQAYKKAQAEFEFERLRQNDPDYGYDKEKQISHQYTELSLNKTAGAFLASENALLDLYKQIFDSLCGACDMLAN